MSEILPEVATARLMDDELDMPTPERVVLGAAVYDELERLRAVIQQVRGTHIPSDEGDFCRECGADYPCPTVRALDGDTTEEGR